MAIQAIETTTGKGAGEVRISHVLVRAPADARRCDESSKAIAAEGQGKELAELDAGVVRLLNPHSCTVPSLPPFSQNPQAQRLLTHSPDHNLLTHSFGATAGPPAASKLKLELGKGAAHTPETSSGAFQPTAHALSNTGEGEEQSKAVPQPAKAPARLPLRHRTATIAAKGNPTRR